MLFSFHIKKFRGCPDWELNLGEKTYIMGPNGSGKTHILEGIHLLANGHLIYNDTPAEPESLFLGGWQTETGMKNFSLYKEGVSEKYSIQGEKVTRIKYRASLPFQTVFVSPFDMNLLYFAPSMRRDYIDSILERKYEQFRLVKRDYENVMRQRNALLKNIREGKSLRKDLDFWDKKFANLAHTYLLYRQKYIQYVSLNSAILEEYLPKYECNFEYQGSVDTLEEQEEYIIKYLIENRERDILTGHTHIGPHRDDFKIVLKDAQGITKDSARYLSRGEIKLLLLSLKLIEVSFLAQGSEKSLILLVDDIFAELDEPNILRFLKSLKTYQTILTSQKPLPEGQDWSEFTCINLKDQ